MKNWLIHKLGGYTDFERELFLSDWLMQRFEEQLSKKHKTISVLGTDYGPYIVKVTFTKDGKQ